MFGGFGFGGGMPGGFPGGMPGGMGGRRARSGPPADTQKMYDQLGIKKTATQPEIRKAWKRKLVKEHPDRGGDEEKFKMTKMAYEILSDEQKRAVYDEGGLEAIKEQAEGGGGGGGTTCSPRSSAAAAAGASSSSPAPRKASRWSTSCGRRS